MSTNLTRRDLIKSTLAGAALAALTGCESSVTISDSASSTTAGGSLSGPPRSFRFVHFTDIHVQRERDGDKGFAAALRAAENLRPRPDFILTGGDMVFDVLEIGADRSRLLFELYKKVIADNTSLPVYNTLGNHDVFGWHEKSGATPATAGYGKAMAMEYFNWSQTYHRFDHKGWRFFTLDNIQPGDRTSRYPYQGYIDGPQMEWLKAELAATDPKMPIIFCEHIPMVTVTNYDDQALIQDKEWRISNAFVCGDAPTRLKLYEGKNVRLCLSGHIHQRDRIEFAGPTFINDGAVCGGWWRGPNHGTQEGFGIIDCHTDGTFTHQYHDYGWEPTPEAKGEKKA